MIRSIRVEDAAFIGEICRSALGHRATAAQLKQQIAELAAHPAYYIAVHENERDKTVLGFLQAEQYHLLYGENGWNIMALAVAPEAQNRGIGKQLVAALEEHALQCGDTFVRLNSRVERINAHRFYERLGYTCDKTQKRFIKRLEGKRGHQTE